MKALLFPLSAAILSAVCLAIPSEEEISEQVAVVTELPWEVGITYGDISLRTDLPNDQLRIKATCTIRNVGKTPVAQLDFDVLGAEQFYGVEVDILKIAQLFNGKEAATRFNRRMKQEPGSPSQTRTHEFPEVTEVFLSPALEEGEEYRLVFDYAITCTDIKKQRHYNLISEAAPGMKETCLITDFAWFPRLAADFQQGRDWRRRNFFSRGPAFTWRMTLIHPAGLEGVVIDGKLEKTERTGGEIVSQWKSVVEGRPQVFIGPAERIEKKGEGVTVVFLLPQGKYNREYVDAVADLLVQAHHVFTDWFGPSKGNEVHIVAPSGISGGHGAFMGMTVEASEFQKKKSDHMTASGKFFADMPVHELAHSWWPGSYGRGTKFLRESLAQFSTWHLAREFCGTNFFAPALKRIFQRGLGGKPLFNAETDEEWFAYEKGPIVLDVLRQEMGNEIFLRTLREFAQRYKHSPATFIDFVSICNEVSRRDWLPFFYQWCYGQGCPAYHLVGFESKEAKGGWETKVRIRNDGAGIVRCPMELQMEGGNREEVFWMPGGEEKTLTYSTEKRVLQVVIDPNKTAFQADQREDLQIEEGGMTDQERAMIEEFRLIKADIDQGERFEDTSTPLHAVLSELATLEGIARDYFLALDVMRAPVPPQNLQKATAWPVYMKYAGGTKLVDTFILIYSRGKWSWNGNLGNGGDWRPLRKPIEEAAKKKAGVQ